MSYVPLFLQDAGKMDATDDLCDERTANFFERAISESRR